MRYHFALSPDVNLQAISDWFIFNTKLQRITGETFHATQHEDYDQLHAAFERDEADLVFASAADTTHLIRDRGYAPLVSAKSVVSEAAIIVAEEGPIQKITDFGSQLRAAATDSPDIERICRILVEPADIGPENLEILPKPNSIGVAKAVLVGEAEAGFLNASSLAGMSNVTKRMLRTLITSHIYVVRTILLASPALSHLIDTLRDGLLAMNDNLADEDLLAGLGAPEGWEAIDIDQAEFMIDLMSALEQG
ncbi:MAG: PhnD/SsuA/transferrin family substrate-binding protein [Arachnia sp.]